MGKGKVSMSGGIKKSAANAAMAGGRVSSDIPTKGAASPSGPKQTSGATKHGRGTMGGENLSGMPTVH
jgi:hypothetical protein